MRIDGFLKKTQGLPIETGMEVPYLNVQEHRQMVKWQLLLLLGNGDDLNPISAEGKNANQMSSFYEVNTIL